MISKYICFWRWRSSLFFVYKRWSRQLSQSPGPASFSCRQGCGSDPFVTGSGSTNVKMTVASFEPRRTDLKSSESVQILSQQSTTCGADIQRRGSIVAWIVILSVYGAWYNCNCSLPFYADLLIETNYWVFNSNLHAIISKLFMINLHWV